jgi:hypothetical protein
VSDSASLPFAVTVQPRWSMRFYEIGCGTWTFIPRLPCGGSGFHPSEPPYVPSRCKPALGCGPGANDSSVSGCVGGDVRCGSSRRSWCAISSKSSSLVSFFLPAGSSAAALLRERVDWEKGEMRSPALESTHARRILRYYDVCNVGKRSVTVACVGLDGQQELLTAVECHGAGGCRADVDTLDGCAA